MYPSTHAWPKSLQPRWLILLWLAASAASFAADGSPTAAPTTACRDDARQHCSSARPGGGRLAACLKQHEDKLSDGCRVALPVMVGCGEELRAICGDNAQPRALRSCLREKASSLSPQCRQMVPAR